MALARNHEIDAILVTELSRWGRSTQDLVQTLDDLHSWHKPRGEFIDASTKQEG
jgi:DNA invertase Pin-like site-specific DNA recombinase